MSAGDIEHRIGIEPLDRLLADRLRLVEQVAQLRARYGPGGTFDALRKIEVEVCQQIARAIAAEQGVKVTEAFLDESAHASDRYKEFVTLATTERAQWAILEAQIDAIDARINRGQALARFAAAELSLTPR